jgi:hypothetical protein
MMIAHWMRAGLGAVAVLVAAELVLQALPVSTATQSGNYVADFMRTYAPNRAYVASADWDLKHPQKMWSNNFGFASRTDFRRDANAVAIIGDSFVEGSAVEEPKRVTAQLQTLLNGRPVYMMGVPGTSLMDYGQRVQWAYRTLGIRDFVIVLEQGDVWQSICGKGQTHRRCLDAQTLTIKEQASPTPSALRQWAAHSALAQYVVGHLRFSTAALLDALAPSHAKAPAPEAPADAASAAERAIVADFLARTHGHDDARFTLLADCDRKALYQGFESKQAPSLIYLFEQARLRGMTVLESCDAFAAHFKRSGERTEISNRDSHWNAAGHQLVAFTIASAYPSRSSTISQSVNSK